MITDWNISSRGHACAGCQNAFADQEQYHTLLFEERAELRRSDVCQTCWETQFSDGARDKKGFISHWQGVYKAPPPVAEPIQKENAESLLRKLIQFQDPRYVPAGFILAVMLERKRLLKVKEQVYRDGQRVFVYEHPRTGDVFTIIDPNLQLNQLEAVQHDVAVLLEHGLPESSPPGPSTDATAAPEQAPAQASQPGDAASADATTPEPLQSN